MAKINLETGTCGRCGGSGRYSYNALHGTTCYGCGGTGVKLTKNGAKAQALLHKLQERPALEVKVGEWIWHDPLSGRGRWRQITAITEDRVTYSLQPGAPLALRFDYMVGTEHTGHVLPAECVVRSVRDDAHLKATVAEALAFQATLKATAVTL